MGYQDEPDHDQLGLESTREPLPEEEEELELDEELVAEALALNKQVKGQAVGRFSIKARRAIEDHLEQRRLRKDVDYLFDDHFTDKSKGKNSE